MNQTKHRLLNVTQNCVLAPNAQMTGGFWAQFRGLAGRTVPKGFALGLPHCDWIHTWGMRGPLDVAFCGPTNTVLRVFLNVPPCRILSRVRGAATAWEMRAGGFSEGRLQTGDVVRFE